MSNEYEFLGRLEEIIRQRLDDRPESSYTARLAAGGEVRMAQKVGEEGVEFALAAVTAEPAEQLNEAADLVYHLLVLLNHKGLSLGDVVRVLEARHGA
jgi:phosphoribosyl-ATP pyrophosphohydrolase/phosphoribosyl-AMP cyclohydrolase